MGMTKYDRLLFILNLLRTHRNLNAAKLAVECGVTERSIYRDVLSLSEANIPIYYDRGYKLASDSFLPPLNFDFEEYSSLKLALESTPLRKISSHAPALQRVRAKIESTLSKAVKDQRKVAPDTTHISIDTTMIEKKAHKFYGPIEHAISERKCLNLTYDSIESGTTNRVVEPYFIVFRGRAFYFVAFCRLRNEMRIFRIDRVESLTLSEEHFVPQKGVDPKSYFEGSWEIFSGKPAEVTVMFTGNAIRIITHTKHHPSERVEKLENGNILYHVTVNGLVEIQRWILGFGDQATVISPVELKNNLAKIGTHLVISYGNSN
jgi:predicted DNA-binding transcriptional regulator YafY